MATIFFCWELGEGLGHAQRLLRLARALASDGHTPVFACANVAEPWPIFQKASFAVLQAPYWNYRSRGEKAFVASSFADVLAVRGWETADTLLPLLEAWRRLVEMVQPALIVTDFAPTLCLAAFRSHPIVQLGNWFSMPPVHADEFPRLLPGRTPLVSQADLLAVVHEVQRRRGKAIPPTLTSILTGDRFPLFFPELDGYGADRREPIWDPLESLPAPNSFRAERRFFAYLTAENTAVEPLLMRLAQSGIVGTAYLRSASADMKARLRALGLTVLDEPAPLDAMLEQSAVFVHHGGSTANVALAAGRPQLLFPQHLEQAINAHLLTKLGVGALLAADGVTDPAQVLRQLLDDPRFAANAEACARRLQERPRRPALPEIMERCRALLG